jgi:hypothetical protein
MYPYKATQHSARHREASKTVLFLMLPNITIHRDQLLNWLCLAGNSFRMYLFMQGDGDATSQDQETLKFATRREIACGALLCSKYSPRASTEHRTERSSCPTRECLDSATRTAIYRAVSTHTQLCGIVSQYWLLSRDLIPQGTVTCEHEAIHTPDS